MAGHGRYIAIILLALAVGLSLDSIWADRYREVQRFEMSRIAGGVAAAIERELAEKVLIADGVTAAFAADPDLTRDQFERIAGQIARNAPDIVNIAVAPDFVVSLVHPLEPNRSVIGLDLRAREDYLVPLAASVASGRTVLGGPYDLVQGGRGLIARTAVTETDEADGLPVPWGIISVVVDVERFFEEAGLGQPDERAVLAVSDADGTLLHGARPARADPPVRVPVDAHGVRWNVEALPPGGWARYAPASNRIWAAVAVVAVTVLTVTWAFSWAFVRKERAERQLAEALESIQDAFALFDADDRLLMCNEKYREFYAESAEVIVPGARFEDIIRHGVRSGQYVEALGREEEWIEERLAAHAEPGAPVEQLLPNGRWIRVEERRTESGNIVGFRVDITELKEALRRSEAASAAKSAFLNTVSHELRTPLTVVLGYNAFLGRMEVLPGYARLREAIEAGDTGAAIQRLEELREEVARYAHQIDASGRHLIDLISGILDLAAIEEGALRLETEELQLGPLIAEVAEQLCPLAQRRGLYLKVEEADVVALADPLRVRQILFNIAGNALKFTETGGITIRSGAAADDVWVEVEDTGVGIAPEDMALVFERFGQLDASDARHHGGAGLGLAISRDLAEMQGGSLEVESERGRGSIFRLRLKARQPVALAAE